jgi:hypothetical protein
VDPVVYLVAAEMGLDKPDMLQTLPPLPHADILRPLLESVYAREVWNRDLLNVDARVVCSASHVDIECPMSAVRLPVRLSGLDLNPGWVPWLGRVVTFHYVSFNVGGER